MTKQVVVLGGGLAGIKAAISARDAGLNVRIIEGSSRLGGLLNGVCINGLEFPLGTHFLRKGPSSSLNALLYDVDIRWSHLPYLKNSNLTNGIIDCDTGFMNISNLSLNLQFNFYTSLLLGFLGSIFASPADKTVLDLDSYLIRQHGPAIRDFFSTFSTKYFNLPLSEQHKDSLSPLLVTSRVKAFTPIISRLLKRFKFFDQRLSFHKSSEGTVPYSSFLPYSFKYSRWWKLVENKLLAKSIVISFNSKCSLSVDRNYILVEQSNSQLEQIHIDSIDLIDTIGLDKNNDGDTHTSLLFYSASSKPLVDSYFITSYTHDCSFSRITLCSNVDPYHNGFVVEIIHSKDKDIDIDNFNTQLFDELRKYKVFDKSTTFEFLKYINLKCAGFRPKKLNDHLLPTNSKWIQSGIANGNQWFMDEVVL